VQLRDRRHEAEAEAVAGTVAAALEAIKSPKNVAAFRAPSPGLPPCLIALSTRLDKAARARYSRSGNSRGIKSI
jgi:hypothetical protein